MLSRYHRCRDVLDHFTNAPDIYNYIPVFRFATPQFHSGVSIKFIIPADFFRCVPQTGNRGRLQVQQKNARQPPDIFVVARTGLEPVLSRHHRCRDVLDHSTNAPDIYNYIPVFHFATPNSKVEHQQNQWFQPIF